MKRIWFKFYPQDWLNGTRGLSLEERGAYMTLLALMYDEQGAIPDDERWVCGALDCDVRIWRRLRDKLCRYGKIVPNSDGFIANRRVLEEVRSAELLAEVRRKSGKHGGQLSGIVRASALKNNDTAEASASISLPYAGSLLEEDIPTSPAKAGSVGPPSVAFSAAPRDEVRDAVEAWNETAARQGWARIAKLTPARRQVIASRLREHGLETWRAMIARTARLEWVNDPARRSAEHKNWQPHIDWFAKSATFLKLVEGAYGGASAANDKRPDWPRREAYFRDTGRWNDAWGPRPDSPDYRGAAA